MARIVRPPITPPAPPEPAKPRKPKDGQPVPSTPADSPPVVPPQVRPRPPVDPVSPPRDVPGSTVLGSYGNASIDQWDSAFIDASDAVRRKKGVRVDPHFMKAVMDVETGGNGNYGSATCRPSDGFDNVPACGPMQIKFAYHAKRCLDCNLSTVPGQIELATHIIGDTMKERGKDEYDALVTTYFPGDDVNGTTQGSYVGRVRKLVGIMEGGTTPAPKPDKPATVSPDGVRRIITGDTPLLGPIFGFNEDNPGQHFYAYGVGHGTSGDTRHTGNDLFLPLGTTVHTPIAGVVRCVGNRGSGDWGQGCGAFPDKITGGVGNVTVLTDAGLKITFGHVNKPLVEVGQRVTAGQAVATTGGMLSPHLHLDVSVNRNGTYWLVDPLPAIAAAMSGAPLPEAEAKPVDIPQPDDAPPYVVVKATRTTPVLQRGNPSSPKVLPDLPAGETFFAQHKVLGVDGRWYYVGRLKGRVAEADTEVVKTVLS